MSSYDKSLETLQSNRQNTISPLTGPGSSATFTHSPEETATPQVGEEDPTYDSDDPKITQPLGELIRPNKLAGS